MANQHPTQERPKKLQYSPLDDEKASFRLLKLLPEKSPDGYVQCELFHASTDEMEGAYTCLSYVWGDRSAYPPVVVVNDTQVEVHDNLECFLQVVYRNWVYRDELLWIDAICIDQNNIREQNHQVSQMGNIYSRAKQVYAWLGPNDGSFSSPLKRLEDHIFPTMSSTRRDRYFRKRIIKNMKARRSGRDSTKDRRERSQEIVKLTNSLGDRLFDRNTHAFFEAADTYWGRAWITQELAVAPRVFLLLGDFALDLSAISEQSLESALVARFMVAPEAVRNLSIFKIWDLSMDQRWREDWGATPALLSMSTSQRPLHWDFDLISLLLQFRHKKCSHPRDRVYSLRYLCAEGESLVVDYEATASSVLRHITQISRPPHCFCEVLALVTALEIQYPSPDPRADRNTVLLEVYLGCPGELFHGRPNPACGSCNPSDASIPGKLCFNQVCSAFFGDFKLGADGKSLVYVSSRGETPPSFERMIRPSISPSNLEGCFSIRIPASYLHRIIPLGAHGHTDCCNATTGKLRFVDTRDEWSVFRGVCN